MNRNDPPEDSPVAMALRPDGESGWREAPADLAASGRPDEALRSLFAGISFTIGDRVRLIAESNLAMHLVDNLSIGINNEWLAAYGLSLTKLNLMLLLWGAPDNEMSMSALSRDMIVTGANITKLVDSLEASGHVRRTRLDGDRRIVLAKLTPEGFQFLEHVTAEHYAFLERLWSDLTDDEMKLLHGLIVKVCRMLSATPRR